MNDKLPWNRSRLAAGVVATLRVLLPAGTGAAPAVTRRSRGRGIVLVAATSLFVLGLAASTLAAPPRTIAGPTAGEHTGQVNRPVGVAVDQSNGDLYVADSNNKRVDEFRSTGGFLTSFGWGVGNGSSEALQTCITSCFEGLPGSGSGQFASSNPNSVAVDNDPSSPSYHDVYAAESGNERVQGFEPDGAFVLMFGKDVNKTEVAAVKAKGGTPTPVELEEENVCTAGSHDKCGAGVASTVAGEAGFSNVYGLPVAVDGSGDVWVGDVNRLEEFGPKGAFKSEVKLEDADYVEGLAVNSSTGELYTLSPTGDKINELQAIAIPKSGEYTFTFGGFTTAQFVFSTESNEKAGDFKVDEELESVLEALPSIGKGNVDVIRGSSYKGSSFELEFSGALAGTNVEQIIASTGAEVATVRQGKAAAPVGVAKRKPSGELIETLDVSGGPQAIGLDPETGDVFVSDQANINDGNTATLLEYAPSGAELEAFGAGQVLGAPAGNALAFADGAKALYTADGAYSGASGSGEESAVQEFAVPPAGYPLVKEGSEEAKPVAKTTATLNATIDPEGHRTTYHFQYVDAADFEKEGKGFASPSTKTTSESASIGEDFTEHAASATLTGLETETTYDFRVVATSECEPSAHPGKPCVVEGEDATFTTLQPLRIDSTYATEVTSTSAMLGAQIDPLGEAGFYRFEYISEAAYARNVQEGAEGFAGATRVPGEAQGDAGFTAGETDEGVAQALSGLEPQTTYRYRVFAHNSSGVQTGPEFAFTTQGAGGPLVLPDDRAWEMVSPVDKDNGGVSGIDHGLSWPVVEAAENGDSITYGSEVSFAGGVSSPLGNQYLSTRAGDGGWSTVSINIPTNNANYVAVSPNPPYVAFSSDLTSALVTDGHGSSDVGASGPPNAPLPGTEAAPGAGNFYVRNDTTDVFQAVLTEADAEFQEISLPLEFEDATPDLSHLIVEEKAGKKNLYEWTQGSFQLLNLLPGKTTPTATVSGAGNGESAFGELHDPRALSVDGSHVVWATSSPHRLYLRENVGQEQSVFGPHGECSEPEQACTVQIDASQVAGAGGVVGKGGDGDFLAASADDSKIFFSDGQRLTADSTAESSGCLTGEGTACGDLYVFEPEAPEGQRLTDLTVDHNLGESAEVQGVLGVSEDGSYVYFVANGVLAANEGASGGHAKRGDCGGTEADTCNLYLYHEGATTFIASPSGDDSDNFSDDITHGNTQELGDWAESSFARTVRLSADGRHLLFMSHQGLTGYDNLAISGTHCGNPIHGELLPLHCSEVYLYEASSGERSSGQLRCVSCNPTGERPLGPSGMPGGDQFGAKEGLYESHVLSADSKRVFFDSYDALVPQDTNEKMDVYEWEAAGEGSCLESSSTYGRASGGCIDLISSGTTGEKSEFADASADGSDVFFVTSASLVEKDPGSVDLYDAREGGGEPAEALPPASCEGDACQTPPVLPDFATPGSLTFSGAGDLAPVPAAPAAKPKAKAKPKRCKKGYVNRKGKCLKNAKGKKAKAKARKATAKQTRENRRAGR